MRFEEAFVFANRLFVASVLAVVFVMVFANVFGRYVLGSSFAWVEEAARHLMILGAFCGVGLALREGRLVAITTFQDVLPVRVAFAVRWAMLLVMFGLMATLCWLGIRFVEFGWNKETMSTGISRGIPYLAIPIGCAIFLVHLVLFARRFVASTFELAEDPALGDAD